MRRIASCQTCIWQYAPCDTSRCAKSVGGEGSGRLSSIDSIPGLRSALPAGAQAGGPIVAWVAVVGWWWVRQTTWLHQVRNLGGSTGRRVSAMGASGRSREIAGIFAHLCEGRSERFPTLRENSRASQRAIQSAICRLPNGATAIGRGALLSLRRLMFGMVHLESCISWCPFGLWRHPLPCLSLAHTNICIHIGRSVPLCNMLAGYLLGTFQY